MSASTGPDAIRPEWAKNNVALFIYWMKTGAAEMPAGWNDTAGETNVVEVMP